MKKTSPVSRSGRFAGGPSAAVAQFTESISFDQRLWRQDIAGSIAHATMLREAGLLTQPELRAIISGLETIAGEIQAGAFRWQPELEDVHMNIESALTRRVPAGAKLHTGRSRNDQVALDMRLWLREETAGLLDELKSLQRALVELGAQNQDVIIPGYTHLQRAQPVFLAHHLLAYAEMLERDRQRLQESLQRVNICPLGSGAIAGRGRRILLGTALAWTAAVGLLGLWRFDPRLWELRHLEQPAALWQVADSPLTALLTRPMPRYAIGDAPHGPFRYCQPRPLQPWTP